MILEFLKNFSNLRFHLILITTLLGIIITLILQMKLTLKRTDLAKVIAGSAEVPI